MNCGTYIRTRSLGPQLLVGGPSGRLDFVLRALRALRPCDPRNDVVRVRLVSVGVSALCGTFRRTDGRTDGRADGRTDGGTDGRTDGQTLL